MDLDPTALRAQIDDRLARGDTREAFALLGELWAGAASPALAGYVLSRFEKLGGAVPMVPVRLALLRSFTVEPLVPLLRAGAAVQGIALEVHVGEFNAYVQEILDPASPVRAFRPDVTLLAVRTEDVAPELWRDFADLDPATVEQVVARVIAAYEGWIDALRAGSRTTVLIHNLEVPAWPAQGVLDAQGGSSQVEAIRRIDQQLARRAAATAGVHVIDWDGLLARHGRLGFHDAKRWLTVRLPIPADRLTVVAEEWLRHLLPAVGRVSKCLVCDLDNTLWGGVVGEDGRDGLQLGVEHPGAAYLQLQRAVLDLSRRGVLLAVCSKNNPDDALDVLRNHPHMLLRPEAFAALRIDWNDKAENLRAIARELNIGVDSLVLMDDNAVECQNVRRQLPEVRVLHLDGDPMGFAAQLRRVPWFERLGVTEEDRQRGELYARDRERAELQQTATSLEDFYHSLRMRLELVELDAATLTRVAQLTQKTNQFNLTTRRYSEAEIAAFAASSRHRLYAARVTDRFGDNGIVVVAIVETGADTWTIDTLLMSCRVIGRTVETAMLAVLVEQARAAGARWLAGEFVPTAKNAPAAEAYARHGFEKLAEDGTRSSWRLDLAGPAVAHPAWIECVATLPR